MIDEAPRLDASIRAMQNFFPEFSLLLAPAGTGRMAVWKGRAQPIQTTEKLAELLDDIHHERPVYILSGGEVRHHSDCTAPHEHHDWAGKLDDLRIKFELEVKYDGGRRHPKAFVRNPPLPPCETLHLFSDGSICPYAPWESVWLWERDTVVDYLGHALIWLIKWTVWRQTGIWIGLEIGHERDFLLRSIGRNQECWCGSGVKYKRCHRERDQTSRSGH
jgi:hypothetical protein